MPKKYLGMSKKYLGMSKKYLGMSKGKKMDKIELTQEKLQDLLAQSAYIGAQKAMDDAIVYHLKDAAERLNMSYPTLKKRIAEGKIKTIDGRITGGEIRRYLELV